MITAETLVAREVRYCVSSLVSTLAGTSFCYDAHRQPALKDIDALADQAFQLASPIFDYEEAARDAGWVSENGTWFGFDGTQYAHWQEALHAGECATHESAEEVCIANDIEPYEREVFEHWIVSDWLADHLIKRGEKVDKDFCGLTVWARTTTGQAIASDYVIDDILRELGEA